MVKLILGIILLALPFLFLFVFKDKKKGFVYVLFFWLLFHTGLAFLTQFFNVFSYGVIIAITAFADLILFLLFARQIKFFMRARPLYGAPASSKNLFDSLSKVDWVLVLVIIIAFLSLWQVHYSYTGKINLATDTQVAYHQVQNMVYSYPYFSDEWYAVLLVENSIESGKLPLTSFGGAHFLNLEMFFHSSVALIFLLLGMNPLTQYVLFSIFVNILIIVLAYIFLRISGVSKLSSGISSLLILYITSGANLPGIWNFIPVHVGIIFCLIGFCFLSIGKFHLAVFACLPVIIFYAPLFIFYALALLVFTAVRFKQAIKKCATWLAYLGVGIFVAFFAIYFALKASPVSGIVDFVFSKVFYTSFYGPNLNPALTFYYIIPIPAFLLALFGVRLAWTRAKWLFAVLLLGIVFWVFYHFTTGRFFIEYERAVFFVSIIVCIIAGFGVWQIESIFFRREKLIKLFKVFSIAIFVVLTPFYTQGEEWMNLVVKGIGANRTVFYPKAPANNYLTNEDLRIFEGINNKRFLSIPWKGTVIGVSTNNHPAVIKEGNITFGSEVDAWDFSSRDCQTKVAIARNYRVEYVYFYEFDCPRFFEKISKSKKGLILYKFLDNEQLF